MTKLLTVVGARPQFIQAATVSRVIRNSTSAGILEVLVHTGQRYDKKMSGVFFDELEIPTPDYNLVVADLSHGAMTGRMLEEIEKVIKCERPDWVLVYGDTNSTLAGALAAAKLHVPIAHVQAGLRSLNMKMPEEINRMLTDRVSELLLCPTDASKDNLAREGITAGVHNVGDVMYDAMLYYSEKVKKHSVSTPQGFGLKEHQYIFDLSWDFQTNFIQKLWLPQLIPFATQLQTLLGFDNPNLNVA